MAPVILMLAAALLAPKEDEFTRETPIGSRLSRPVDAKEFAADQARRIQAGFGECVVKKQPELTKEFVLKPRYEKDDLRKIFPKIGDGWCLLQAADSTGSLMRFPGDTLRYTFADVLIRKEFTNGAPNIADAGPIQHAPLVEGDYLPSPRRKASAAELEELALNRQKALVAIYLSKFGECVVRSNPVASYQLINSKILTPEESAAFTALAPSFGPCVEAGQSFKLDKSAVRGTIAMNLYRLAHAPRVVGNAQKGSAQ
jgi:hypothetical protein